MQVTPTKGIIINLCSSSWPVDFFYSQLLPMVHLSWFSLLQKNQLSISTWYLFCVGRLHFLVHIYPVHAICCFLAFCSQVINNLRNYKVCDMKTMPWPLAYRKTLEFNSIQFNSIFIHQLTTCTSDPIFSCVLSLCNWALDNHKFNLLGKYNDVAGSPRLSSQEDGDP